MLPLDKKLNQQTALCDKVEVPLGHRLHEVHTLLNKIVMQEEGTPHKVVVLMVEGPILVEGLRLLGHRVLLKDPMQTVGALLAPMHLMQGALVLQDLAVVIPTISTKEERILVDDLRLRLLITPLQLFKELTIQRSKLIPL